MKWAYVDSSVVLATIFEDQPAKKLAKLWGSAERFISSYLLEVEVFSAMRREQVDVSLADEPLRRLGFVQTRSLAQECKEILRMGYLRGADLFHLATAVWVRDKFTDLKFFSFDRQQMEIADKLGF